MKSIFLSIFISVLSTAVSADQWTTTISKDEMTGSLTAYALSPSTSSIVNLSFPYSGTQSRLVVACSESNSKEWVYFFFTTAPNLTGTDTRDGFNAISTRVKWDDSIHYTKLTQKWGSKFIRFYNHQFALEKIESSEAALLELEWHGNPNTYFRYNLNGSKTAIKEIRDACLIVQEDEDVVVTGIVKFTDPITKVKLIQFENSTDIAQVFKTSNLLLDVGWYISLSESSLLKTAKKFKIDRQNKYPNLKLIEFDDRYAVFLGPYDDEQTALESRQSLRTTIGSVISDLSLYIVD